MTLQLNGTTGVDNIQPGVVQTADLAPLAVTPDKTNGFVVTQANQTPLPGVGSLLSFTHGLGTVPVSAELEVVCLTAEAGYSVGDIVTPFTIPNVSYAGPFTPRKTSTVVEARTGNTNSFVVNHLTTGASTALTAANWAWRFKVRAA